MYGTSSILDFISLSQLKELFKSKTIKYSTQMLLCCVQVLNITSTLSLFPPIIGGITPIDGGYIFDDCVSFIQEIKDKAKKNSMHVINYSMDNYTSHRAYIFHILQQQFLNGKQFPIKILNVLFAKFDAFFLSDPSYLR